MGVRYLMEFPEVAHMDYPCFLLEPMPRVRRGFRRYARSETSPCPAHVGYHQATAWDGVIRRPVPAGGVERVRPDVTRFPRTNWPAVCEGCSYEFTPLDYRQVWEERLYAPSDGGSEVTLRGAGVGAMWFADWITHFSGPDGRALVVKVPGGHDWMIDHRASNCTLPEDNEHRCWVRHGSPPAVTVDKDGVTCSAGAGSLAVPGWHGFLRDGVLVEA